MGNENVNPQPPQPDDLVLLNFQQSFGALVSGLNAANRKIAELETAKLLQQKLIDSLEIRLETVERLLQGGAVN